MHNPETFHEELERLGEGEVRLRVAKKVYGERKLPLVQEWLRRRERERHDAVAADQQAREEAALKLASESNSIARDANALSSAGNETSTRSNLIAWLASESRSWP